MRALLSPLATLVAVVAALPLVVSAQGTMVIVDPMAPAARRDWSARPPWARPPWARRS